MTCLAGVLVYKGAQAPAEALTMLRTLPAIHELLSEMDGKISQCALSVLSLPVRFNSTSVISHTCEMDKKVSFEPSDKCRFSCEMDKQVSFEPSDKCRFSCEMDNRLTTIVTAPYDPIIPKLTHMEAVSDELAAPAVGECVHVNGESCLDDVNVELVNNALWKKFYEEGHEMVVTKPGRSMFPILEFKVTGLTPDESFKLAVDFVFVDKFRYRYFSPHNGWRRSASDGVVGPARHRRYFEHQLSPAVGETFTTETVSFEKLRISNHPSENMVHLSTMRKYKIQLVVTKLHCAQCRACTRRFNFPLTEFIAVSNYQNVKLKQLKIRYNPFAKAFREDWKKSVVIPYKLSSGHKSQATQESRRIKQRKGEVNAKKRKREDIPAQQPSTSKDCRNDSKHPRASGTTPAVPTGYIDLSRAIHSAIQRQENEIVSPRVNHTTCSTWQPTELLADHRPSHSYPKTEYSHTYYSSPSRPLTPCAIPDSYHDNPAMGTWEVNTPVAYNSNDAYYSCDYSGNYPGSNFDDYQAVACDGSGWNIMR